MPALPRYFLNSPCLTIPGVVMAQVGNVANRAEADQGTATFKGRLARGLKATMLHVCSLKWHWKFDSTGILDVIEC